MENDIPKMPRLPAIPMETFSDEELRLLKDFDPVYFNVLVKCCEIMKKKLERDSFLTTPPDNILDVSHIKYNRYVAGQAHAYQVVSKLNLVALKELQERSEKKKAEKEKAERIAKEK